MPFKRALFWLVGVGLLAVLCDQAIKQWILQGFRAEGPVISIVLAYNKGVAFSMLEFLGPWLKYLQTLLIVGMAVMILSQRDLLIQTYLAFGLILGGGSSNLLDRFVHGHVIDYVYWHYKFDFAVFNLADVLIDIGVGLLLLDALRQKLSKNKSLKAKDQHN
ncbi:signal peptidase II [Helicobacter salomonis]|uniref:signal peptidase II n=1 Tax=Helicobacter salomonis TaxID=56878 RepID=UPI000CF0836A|nr:signal peptidase II [Helicobacter salomonis]